jgi:hypothetical protein
VGFQERKGSVGINVVPCHQDALQSPSFLFSDFQLDSGRDDLEAVFSK